jgi:hypothetical protein
MAQTIERGPDDRGNLSRPPVYRPERERPVCRLPQRLNMLLRSLEHQKGNLSGAKLNKKTGGINALIKKLDHGKTVF